MRLRRLYCENAECSRRIFCESLGEFAPRHAHATTRLQQAQFNVAKATSAEAGARLAHRLAMPVSVDTLLRRLRQWSHPPEITPHFVGIDDFAFRKGQCYGTIVIDLESHRPLDLLADRQTETVAAWLRQHPTIEVVSRDRAGSYAKAAREALLGAQQVADR